MPPQDELTKMNDADLVRGAADALREDRRRLAHEERLEAYAEGRIDADVVRTLAKRDGVDEDIEDELVAFAPLGERARDRVTARLVEQATRDAARRAKRRAAWGRFGAVLGTLAMAASLAIAWRAHAPLAPSLPGYEVAFAGGEQEWRGESDAKAEHRARRGERVRLDARPRTAVDGPVEARLFVRRGADVRAWPAAMQVSAAGAVRVVAAVDALPAGTTGAWDLVLVVGRPEAMPTAATLDAKDAAATLDAKDAAVKIVTTPIELEP